MRYDLNGIFAQTIELASRFAGATSPNPCVGAAALDSSGKILGIQAHKRAGEPHAEAELLAQLRANGTLGQAETLIVTLEPCNHFGKTPPCTEAIISNGIRRVIFGARDPNPKVAGRGSERLRAAGLEVIGPEELPAQIAKSCLELIRSFSHWAQTGLPWVTLKTAMNLDETMIPPSGQKTFTSPESLKLAHALRKRADAVLTGSGTILADQPAFTVRHIPDHARKSRWIAILDRRNRVSDSYVNQAKLNGFQVHIGRDLQETLRFLGSQGVLEVLVEAGPTLTKSVIEGDFWDEHVLIKQKPNAPDQIEIRRN